MAHAYTPGLIVSALTNLTKLRELPLLGEALVSCGQEVRYNQPVLRAKLPGEVDIVRLMDITGLDAERIKSGLQVNIGDCVSKGDLLFETKLCFGLFSSKVQSPTTGTVEFFTEATGHLGIRHPSTPVEVLAYIDGTVTEVEAGKSVSIEADAALLQGIFGVGGERFGRIYGLDVALDRKVEAGDIEPLGENIKNSILIGGQSFSIEALTLAGERGASAVVTASIDSQTLNNFLGYEIGVAITGDEALPFTLIITEGFGGLSLSRRIHEFAKKFHGKEASVNGATQVRAGAMRPEVIVHKVSQTQETQTSPSVTPELTIGSSVRIIRVPYFGETGAIEELPTTPEKIESGAIVRIAKVRLSTGQTITVPRANIELA